MNPNPAEYPSKTPAVVISTILILALAVAVGFVLKPFTVPLLWAMILVIATWPLYNRLRGFTPQRPWIPALGLTIALGLILLIVAIPLPLKLAGEVRQLGQNLEGMSIEQLAAAARGMPLVGTRLGDRLVTLLTEEQGILSFLASNQQALVRFATRAAVSVVDVVSVVLMSLVGCFLLYSNGETLLSQSRAIAKKLGARQIDHLFHYVGMTIRGAAYSVIATAIAQGVIAGLGYSAAGAPLPFLLTIVTMVVSLIPFGAPLIYVPVAAYLIFFTDLPWYHGVGLLVWCIACVSTIDNLLRSLLISQATHVSPSIVFIGVLGGVLAFGLLGVFVGPALVGIAQTLWCDFAQEQPRSND
jgi:predicted PurR-regulated permease PerM